GANAVKNASATAASTREARMCWWQALMGAQMIAHILPAAFVADIHFVAASCAPGDAVQQKFALARSPSRLRAHVFGSVVFYDAADVLIGRPVDIRRIAVLHDDPPFSERTRYLCRQYAFARDRTDAG